MTGSDVKQIRLQLGLTQTVFAYGLGVSIRVVTSWELDPTPILRQATPYSSNTSANAID